MYTTVIFDMDGLLIDSEPLWGEAADEVFSLFGIKITPEDYKITTGLRTKEFVAFWFKRFNVNMQDAAFAERKIIDLILQKVQANPKVMQGVDYIFDFFKSRGFKIGLASSSPQSLINIVIDILQIKDKLDAVSSAETLAFGKPHPQVYIDCAEKLNSDVSECICFEDSFNGMIAAKAAKMKCVVVPHHHHQKEERWGAADLKLSSLQNFSELHYNLLF